MTKKGIIWHIALIVYIGFIFSNSLTPAVESSEESGRLLLLIQDIMQRFDLTLPWLTEHILRKFAHFSEYMGLGFLLWQNRNYLRCKESVKQQIHLAAGYLIPFVDETLQLFTEGRSGQISDVWLDMSGVLFGTLIMWLFHYLLKNENNRK